MNELVILEHLQRLDVKPGEVLVAKFAQHLTRQMAEIVQEQFRAAFAGTSLEGVKVLVIDGDVELGVVSAEPGDPV